MTAGKPRSQRATALVGVEGDAEHADAVREIIRADGRVELAEGDRGATAEEDADGVDCVCLDDPGSETLATPVQDRARPTLVVLPSTAGDESVAAAYAAGAAAVCVGADDTLPARLSWLAGTRLPDAADRPDGESLAATAETFGDATCVVDHRFRIRTAAASFTDLTGASGEDVDGRSLWTACPSTRTLAEHCWAAVLDGERRTVGEHLDGRQLELTAVPLADGLALRLRDVSDRTDAIETVDRYETILETIDDGIYTLDENFQIVEVNEAVTEMTGYSREELVGSHSTMLADESVIVEAAELIQEILTGQRASGSLDVELETADGGTLPVETRFSALRFSDGSHGSVGVIRDISDRKRYERTLTALNSSARRLFRAESRSAVGETVFETATEVLELTSAIVYLYDEETGELRPCTTSDGMAAPVVGPGDGVLWESFVEGATRDVVAPGDSLDGWGDLAAAGGTQGSDRSGLVCPLGEHGLFVTMVEGESPRGQGTLTRLLAANAEAALDRVARSVELERRKEELADRNQELGRLNRFNELLREVNRVLVEANSREEIEREVCNRLVDSPHIAFAWLGTPDSNSGAAAARAWAGTERGYLDYLGDAAADIEGEPSLVAARTGETTVVDNVAVDVQREKWRRQALDRGFSSVVSIPLVYNEFRYGVLTVYATDRDAFDEGTRRMFEELGGTTANAINSVEAKESLHTGSLVELDLRVTSPNALLFRIARAAGDELRLEGSVPKADGTALHYLTLGDDADLEAIESLTAVVELRAVVERDGETLYEVQTAEETLPSRVADLGGSVTRLVADGTALDLTVELAPGADVREFVETLRESYPDTQLSAKRRRERAIDTTRGLRADIEDVLTERQFEVLRSAYLSGYFSWPRDRSGQDIADSLGIAQPTFARHLRVAERKLLDRLLNAD